MGARCRKFQVVDLAASESSAADYTVIGEFWATPEGDLLVRAIARGRIAVPDQPAFFRSHHAGCPVRFESIGYQAGIIQTMLREGFPAEPVYPDADKLTRAAVAGVLYRAGKIYHLAGADWLADLEGELLAFPASSTTAKSTRSPTRRGRCPSTSARVSTGLRPPGGRSPVGCVAASSRALGRSRGAGPWSAAELELVSATRAGARPRGRDSRRGAPPPPARRRASGGRTVEGDGDEEVAM